MILRHILSVLAFAVVSFAAQGLSHFAVNADHFAAITHLRADPVIPMGLAAMVVQGGIMSVALHRWHPRRARVTDGLAIALAFGVFLVSYIALVEPAKYTVPDIRAWIAVEAVVGAVQFTLFGVVLGAIHAWPGQPTRVDA
ncbi:hypothetical protein [uncultured Tateyamaria sp.]|uniref:hypothetical protein n=1 Tax=Tateyamaria sp. 1078 TaxID=3417464 RepID=UPI00261E7A29|nr:hypothetical protein [uncultured Tateyamaria sp.]